MIAWWLIRHGETDWNLNGRFQGSSDVSLNATGQKQAEALIPRLAEMAFDAIYASDLQRVRETVRAALNGRDESIIFDQRLREMDFGRWEGLTWDEIREQYPQEFAMWSQNRDQNPHGGERISEMAGRVQTFIDDLQEKYQGEKQILIFAHGGTLGIMLCQLFQVDINKWWQFRFQNCTMNEVLFFKQGFVLNRFNDDQHLQI